MTDFFAFYNYRVEKYIRHENYQLESDFGQQFSYYFGVDHRVCSVLIYMY